MEKSLVSVLFHSLDPEPTPLTEFVGLTEGQALKKGGQPSLSPSAVFPNPPIIYHGSIPSITLTAGREGEEVNHMTRYKNGQKERNTNRVYQHQITLYVSDAQMDFMESECNKLSMKLSTYIRDLIDKEKAEYESYLKK